MATPSLTWACLRAKTQLLFLSLYSSWCLLACGQSQQPVANPATSWSAASLFDQTLATVSTSDQLSILAAAKAFTIPQVVTLIQAFAGVREARVDGFTIKSHPLQLSLATLQAAAEQYPTIGSFWLAKGATVSPLAQGSFTSRVDAFLSRPGAASASSAETYELSANLLAGAIIALSSSESSKQDLALINLSGLFGGAPPDPTGVGVDRAKLAFSQAQKNLANGNCQPASLFPSPEPNAPKFLGQGRYPKNRAVQYSRPIPSPLYPNTTNQVIGMVGVPNAKLRPGALQEIPDNTPVGRSNKFYPDGSYYDAAVGADGSQLFYCAIPLNSEANAAQVPGLELYLAQLALEQGIDEP